MFAIILAAFLADAPAPAPTAAPSAGPLREIVYKYALDVTGSTTIQSYDQAVDSATSVGGYHGSMTIDVLQVDPSNGYLRAHVKDSTTALNYRAPTEADIIIHPDGELIVTAGKVDEDMATIVPYLGTKYFGDNALQQGNQWSTYSTSDGIDYKTTTTVSTVSGDIATISLETRAEKGVMNGAFQIEGKVGYEASKLVPVTLDVMMTRQASGVSDQGSHTVHYHFDRVSDTLDKPTG